MDNTVDNIYNQMLRDFRDTLKQISEDVNKVADDKYMTLCEAYAVNFDKFKNHTFKKMNLGVFPKSCDALYRNQYGAYFLVEFKNGIIEVKKNYEIKIKIFESLLMLTERFSQTADFMRNNLTFILVYNDDVEHGKKEFENTGLTKLGSSLSKLSHGHMVRFGLQYFEKLYFKDVYTYSKSEFEAQFVSKFCI